MFSSINSTFNQLASVAASLQNLDELQDGQKVQDIDDSFNKQVSPLATNANDSGTINTNTSSNFSSFNFFGQSSSGSNNATDSTSTLVIKSTEDDNPKSTVAAVTAINKSNHDFNSDATLSISSPTAPIISHELCDKEINRLTTELETALNKFQLVETEMKTQENKHLKVVDKYKIKLRETKDQTTALREELNLLSKRYEDKLNQLQLASATTVIAPTSMINPSNENVGNQLKQSSFFDDENDSNSNSITNEFKPTDNSEIITTTSNPTPIPALSISSTDATMITTNPISQEMEIALEKYYLQEQTFQSARMEWQIKENDLNEIIEQNNKELIELTTKYQQESLNKIHEIEVSYQNEKRALEVSHQAECSILQSQLMNKDENISKLQDQLMEKEVTITDWQDKMKLLTDKIRDLMSKYTTLKGKYQLLEQADEKSAVIAEAMQTKESELLSIRLKLDNALQKVQEEYNTRMDLSDRYGETQRELNRCREGLQHVQLSFDTNIKENEILINSMKSEYESLMETMKNTHENVMNQTVLHYKSTIESFNQEKNELLNNLTDLKSIYTIQSSEYQELLKKSTILEMNFDQLQQQQKHILQDKESSNQLKLQQYEIKIQQLNNQLIQHNNTDNQFDDYKKRAQQALKKANNQLSELNMEVQKLKLQLSEAQEKADLIEEMTDTRQIEEAKIKKELTTTATTAAVNDDDDDHMHRVQELEAELKDIKSQLAMAQSRAVSLAHDKGELEERIKGMTPLPDATAAAAGPAGSDTQEHRVTHALVPPLDAFTITAHESDDGDENTTIGVDTQHVNYINSSRSDLYNDSSKSVSSSINNNNHSNHNSNSSSSRHISTRSLQSSRDGGSSTPSGSQSQLARVTAATAEAMADLENNPASYSNSNNSRYTTSSSSSNSNSVNELSSPSTQQQQQQQQSSAPPLYLVNELYMKLDEARRQSRAVEEENNELTHDLLEERNQKRQLATKVEELMAFLDRTKSMRSPSSSSDSNNSNSSGGGGGSNNGEVDMIVNMEYLKNCVYKFMVSDDVKDKIRLSNVISTILKLTSQERKEVSRLLEAELHRVNRVDESITNLASFATSFFRGSSSNNNSSSTPLKQSQSSLSNNSSISSSNIA